VDLSLAPRPGMTSTAWPSPRGARASAGSVADSAPASQAERAKSVRYSALFGARAGRDVVAIR